MITSIGPGAPLPERRGPFFCRYTGTLRGERDRRGGSLSP